MAGLIEILAIYETKIITISILDIFKLMTYD